MCAFNSRSPHTSWKYDWTFYFFSLSEKSELYQGKKSRLSKCAVQNCFLYIITIIIVFLQYIGRVDNRTGNFSFFTFLIIIIYSVQYIFIDAESYHSCFSLIIFHHNWWVWLQQMWICTFMNGIWFRFSVLYFNFTYTYFLWTIHNNRIFTVFNSIYKMIENVFIF